ncbi:MAG TPA: GspH/FimT family pseudopilin [Gemmatimonadales bacterium]|jgi:Tfp pilus assembly protein FimT|nr:GspH/FimT family pseudopilin [Gemmatimonadales bacterium]
MYRSEQRPRREHRVRPAGFSLTEMLILIVMLSILASLAIPRLDYNRFRVNADARNVMMTLAYAQRLAVSLQHNVQVTFDASYNQVRTLEDANDDGLFTSNERVRGFQLTEGVVFSQNSVADLPAPSPTNLLTQVSFWRDGSANTAGVVYLNTRKGIARGDNEDARALEIARATGRTNWWTYTGGSWRKGN